MTGKCPCDTCVYKKDNMHGGPLCPNFDYFWDAFMNAYDGVLKTDPCKDWKGME